jgi:type I restriction enzyme S subunit
MLRPGDVVLAMDRPWIEAGLKHATLTEADCPSLLVQRVARLRARPGLDQRYLGYVIRSADFTNYILGVQTGTAVPHISGGQIKAFEFSLPSLEQQARAAELLGVLDDKIGLNRRMAATLEAMARALFKSWFVDFDPVRAKAQGHSTGLPGDVAALFPNGFGEDGLPIGWTSAPLSEFVALDRTTQDPTAIGDASVDHFSIPAFDATGWPALEPASSIKSLKLDLTPPLILFSKLNPETPRVWPVVKSSGRPMLASTEFLALKPRPGRSTLAHLASLLASAAFRDRAIGMVTGTSKSHQRVQPPSLLKSLWLVPETALLSTFDGLAAPMLLRITAMLIPRHCNRICGARRDSRS